MLRKTALTQPAGQHSAVGTPTLSLAVKDQGGGEGRLRRGMAGVQEWPPGLDHRRPFLTRTLARGCIYTFPFQSPRCGAGCPGMFLPVLMTLGKCSCFRAKAAHISGHLPRKWQNPGFLFRGFLEFYIYYLTVLRLQERCSFLLLV